MFKRSAHLEKEDCVILADGELNQSGALLVTRVLHVDVDDLLLEPLQNVLVVIDIRFDVSTSLVYTTVSTVLPCAWTSLKILVKGMAKEGREQCEGRCRSVRV